MGEGRGEEVQPATVDKEATMRINYAIVFVSDMKRSVAFYRDVFGVPLRF